ncbi:c-di-GMP phosphodiesterase [Clostridia bacterium]|nr:c-di-GMP phosphodiesterase [Clostridia bacterium]
MKLVSINSLKTDDFLASDILSSNGRMLLRRGEMLTQNRVSRLKTVGIYTVYVEDSLFDDVKIRTALSDSTKARLLGQIESMHESIRRGRKIDEAAAKTSSREIFEEVRVTALEKEPVSIVSNFAVDSPLLLHSLNVATLTALMAAKLGIAQKYCENYVLAAMLHDMFLEKLENDSEDSYTEDSHTTKLYDYLKSGITYDATCYMAAAMHHERFDGSGAPRKLKGHKINEGARIIAVADMFDGVSSGYAGFPRLPAYQAMEFIMAQAATTLDPDVVKVFAEHIAVYPTGATVTLNNALKALVVRQNSSMPARPVVRLLSNDPTERLEFDLVTQATMFIDKVEL